MNTAKKYYDSDGNECSIWKVVRLEPDWAASRIQEGEKAIERLKELGEWPLSPTEHGISSQSTASAVCTCGKKYTIVHNKGTYDCIMVEMISCQKPVPD